MRNKKIKKYLIIMIIGIFLFISIQPCFAATNDGNVKDNPFSDKEDIESSYQEDEYYDVFIPYKKTNAEIGGYIATDAYGGDYYLYSTSAVRNQSFGDAWNIEFELSGLGSYNNNYAIPKSRLNTFTWSVDDNTSCDVYQDSSGNQYLLAAFPYGILLPYHPSLTNTDQPNNIRNLASEANVFKVDYGGKNSPVPVDVILTDGTILHFLFSEAIGTDHSINGTNGSQDDVSTKKTKINYPQYSCFKHIADPQQIVELWCRNLTKFTEYFNLGTGEDKVQIRTVRVYKHNWLSGNPIRTNGKEPYTKGTISSGHKEVSIYQELLGGVTQITLTNGSSFLNPDNNKESINLEIYNSIKEGISTNDNSYSLYELYGPNLRFFQYFGEETTDITLIDSVVNKLRNGEELSLSDINYKSTVYLSNQVYNNRPVPLNTDMVKSGYLDPRVKIYNEKLQNIVKGNLLFKANLLLGLGEIIVGITNLFINNKFFAFIVGWFNELAATNFWKNDLPTILNWLIPLFMTIFIISIIAYAIKFQRGQAGIKQVIIRLITGIIALGIISVAIIQTTTINNIVIIGTTLIDDVFAESLEEVYSGDEVIASDIKDNKILDKDINTTTEAAIWKVAIFQPWCIGMFGDKYENLYTQFSDKPEKNKFAQSHEDIENLDESDDEAHFDSATVTGDVVVDVGKGKQIRNWAAYAWSCQSNYHIDHSIWEEAITIEEPTKIWIPAKETANGAHYADVFRVIDAKMNISPQYYSDGTEITSYSDSNYFELHLMKALIAMIVRLALLLVMWPIIIRKVSAFLQLILTAIKFVYYSFIELWREGAGYSVLFPQFRHYFSKYIYSSMQLYILIFLYTSFIDKGFLWMVAYLILAYAVINVKVSDFSAARLKVRTFRKKVFG